MDVLKRSFLGTICAALNLVLCQAPAAEPAFAACSKSCRPTELIARSWQPASLYPTSLVPSSWMAVAAATSALRPDRMLEWQPPNHWLEKLRGVSGLRLLTLWESDAARLFFEINAGGVPGISFSSRRPPPKAATAHRNAGTWPAAGGLVDD
jgi:hypothetical protein